MLNQFQKYPLEQAFVLLLRMIAILLVNPLVLTFSPAKNGKSPWPGRLAIGLLLCAMVFSIGATRDYLTWNRTRWTAYDWLRTEQAIPRIEIDGGFEVNEWSRQTDPGMLNPDDQLFYVPSRAYMVTFNQPPGYELLRAFPCQRIFPPGPDSILVVRQLPPAAIP